MTRTVPSFHNLVPVSAQASRTKARTRSRDTSVELVLRRELFRRGKRFRVNVSTLPGKPDIVFTRQKVVVFCDGDFWHGRNWPQRRKRLAKGHNAEYWIAKIGTNIRRDREQTRLLKQLGWVAVRLWETDIKKRPDIAVEAVLSALARNGE